MNSSAKSPARLFWRATTLVAAVTLLVVLLPLTATADRGFGDTGLPLTEEPYPTSGVVVDMSKVGDMVTVLQVTQPDGTKTEVTMLGGNEGHLPNIHCFVDNMDPAAGVAALATGDIRRPAYVAACRKRPGGGGQILAQSLDDAGKRVWGSNGVTVTSSSNSQKSPQIAGDGQGGAVVVWEQIDGFQQNLYGQRLDSGGNKLWGKTGKLIADGPTSNSEAQIMNAGGTGTILTWMKTDSKGNSSTWAQGLDANGNGKWGGGVRLSQASPWSRLPRIVSDDAGGAFVAWQNKIGGTFDAVVQRLNPGGQTMWKSGGVQVASGSQHFTMPRIDGDGQGGVVVAWQGPDGTKFGSFTQRLDSSGQSLWGQGGVKVNEPSQAGEGQGTVPTVACDGTGGAVVCWQGFDGSNYGVWSQRLNCAGNPQFSAENQRLTTLPGKVYNPVVRGDGRGRTVAVFQSDSGGVTGKPYAQKIIGGAT